MHLGNYNFVIDLQGKFQDTNPIRSYLLFFFKVRYNSIGNFNNLEGTTIGEMIELNLYSQVFKLKEGKQTELIN